MFDDLRLRLDRQGLGYLSDNNVLRYLNSYLWNIGTAEMRLVNTEKWRQENNCMQVHISEIQNEINMKVSRSRNCECCSSSLFMGMIGRGGLWCG